MPGSIVQASPGGRSPRTIKIVPNTLTSTKFEVQEQDHQLKDEDHQGDEQAREEDDGGSTRGIWMPGANEEENTRYRCFLEYMESKR